VEDLMAQTYLKIQTTPPPADHVMDWILSLGEIADAVSAHEVEALISMGHAVQVAALAALATPPGDLPPGAPPPAEPDAARAWLETHGAIADDANAGGREALIAAGEAVPIMAALLVMQCPAWLETMIREAMP